MKRYINSIKHLKKPLLFWKEYYKRKENSDSAAFDLQLKGGLKLKVPNDLISALDEVFLREVYNLNGKRVSASPTIIDIGANVGYFCLYAFQRFPDAQITAFEPFPSNHSLLEQHKTINNLERLILDKRAVAGERKTLKFNYNPEDEYSVGASVINRSGSDAQIEVEAITLQDVYEEFEVSTCDVLKIDCEGAEYEILFNAPKDVYDRTKIIVIEMHSWVSSEIGTPEKLISFLEERAFQVNFINNEMLWAVKP